MQMCHACEVWHFCTFKSLGAYETNITRKYIPFIILNINFITPDPSQTKTSHKSIIKFSSIATTFRDCVIAPEKSILEFSGAITQVLKHVAIEE